MLRANAVMILLLCGMSWCPSLKMLDFCVLFFDSSVGLTVNVDGWASPTESGSRLQCQVLNSCQKETEYLRLIRFSVKAYFHRSKVRLCKYLFHFTLSSCILIIGPKVSKVHTIQNGIWTVFFVKYGYCNRTGFSAPDCASSKNPVLIAVGPPSLAGFYREFP
jgi:hypothetical protein